MSIFRQPYERHDHRGGLDSALVYYLLSKYGQEDQWWLEQFPGGETVKKIAEQLGIKMVAPSFEDGYDARDIPDFEKEFLGILSHPPYWRAIKYSESPRDLSNCATYEEFLEEWEKCITEAERVLKPGGWLIIITGDVRRARILYPLHSDTIQFVKQFSNLVFRETMIWELSATGTGMLGTEWMIMGNYCLIWEKLGHDAGKEFA